MQSPSKALKVSQFVQWSTKEENANAVKLHGTPKMKAKP